MKLKKLLKENLFFIISIIVITLLYYIKLPYYVNAPGGTININNRIVYDGKSEYNGSLNMLYVTEYVATIPTYLVSYILPDWDLESIDNSRISDESPKEIDFRNRIMLDNSIDNAMLVAYKEAGKEIDVVSRNTFVIGTMFDNELRIGDEILEVNGIEVENISTVKEVIRKSNVGDIIHLKIKRKSKIRDIDIKIREHNHEKVIGVVIVTNYEYKASPKIKLKFKKSESGASGGMMMALSIYCTLSGEDLLRGRNVAGTGTIESDGTIGEISGIKYKIIGAHRKNMDIVLVPSGNYKEAVSVVKKKKYNMKVVKVNTLKDAIDYLKK